MDKSSNDKNLDQTRNREGGKVAKERRERHEQSQAENDRRNGDKKG